MAQNHSNGSAAIPAGMVKLSFTVQKRQKYPINSIFCIWKKAEMYSALTYHDSEILCILSMTMQAVRLQLLKLAEQHNLHLNNLHWWFFYNKYYSKLVPGGCRRNWPDTSPDKVMKRVIWDALRKKSSYATIFLGRGQAVTFGWSHVVPVQIIRQWICYTKFYRKQPLKIRHDIDVFLMR